MAHELRDPDIRVPLDNWLRQKHAEEEACVIHELRIPRPSARIDIALVNGSLCGYEIKSDVDSLRRLRRQSHSFGHIFDRMFVVTTKRHLAEVRRSIPAWWGIMSPVLSGERTEFRPVRKGRRNPKVHVASVLHILTRAELLDILRNIDPHGASTKLKRSELVDLICAGTSARAVKGEIRSALKRRSVGKPQPQFGQSSPAS